MAMLTIRKLSEAVHRALRARAVRHGRIMEAEVLEILAATVNPNERVKLGTPLGSFGTEARLTDDESAAFDQIRDRSPARRVNFE